MFLCAHHTSNAPAPATAKSTRHPNAGITKQTAADVPPPKPEAGNIPDIAAASVPDTLAALQVNRDTGLTQDR